MSDPDEPSKGSSARARCVYGGALRRSWGGGDVAGEGEYRREGNREGERKDEIEGEKGRWGIRGFLLTAMSSAPWVDMERENAREVLQA